MKNNSFMGNVLALGARLAAQGKLPPCVVNDEPGCYALYRVGANDNIDDAGDIRSVTQHTGALTIGRAESDTANVWCVDCDSQISRTHCVVRVNEDGFLFVEDSGSRNGTFVNDTRIAAAHKLTRGDCLRVGRTTFIVL